MKKVMLVFIIFIMIPGSIYSIDQSGYRLVYPDGSKYITYRGYDYRASSDLIFGDFSLLLGAIERDSPDLPNNVKSQIAVMRKNMRTSNILYGITIGSSVASILISNENLVAKSSMFALGLVSFITGYLIGVDKSDIRSFVDAYNTME